MLQIAKIVEHLSLLPQELGQSFRVFLVVGAEQKKRFTQELFRFLGTTGRCRDRAEVSQTPRFTNSIVDVVRIAGHKFFVDRQSLVVILFDLGLTDLLQSVSQAREIGRLKLAVARHVGVGMH